MKKLLSTRPLVACIASTLFCSSVCLTASAQLSTNPDKFLGNITTGGSVDSGKEKFYMLWNQITPENESKWSSVQGSSKTTWTWGGVDNCVNYAKSHNFPFKFHTFVWGSQFPNWLKSLSLNDRYDAIVNWMDGAKKRYAKLDMIDVVNEAVEGHQDDTKYIKPALGGGGKTGYDWLIKAFELAYERYPNSILIYNDFNTFQWNTDQYIELVRTLRDAGAPVDAYGCQSHDMLTMDGKRFTGFRSSMDKIQSALKMPMFSTEYDVGTDDDQLQLECYKDQIPYMWEAEYCGGITLWGYIYGRTWTTNGNSGIIKNGNDRPAMTWLRDYMKSEKAKNAKGPYPGMKKRVSVFVRPRGLNVAKGDVLPIKVRTFITDDAKAEKADIAIDKVELYVGTELVSTMTEDPYIAEYNVPSNSSTGWKTLKAIVYTNDGNKYERLSRFNVLSSTMKREPYSETVPELPGTINVNEYDKGASGVSYNKAISRTATSATQTDGWMEYTVDVKEDGIYSFNAEVASAKTGGVFHISEYGFDNLTFYTDILEVPSTGGNSNYQKLHGVFKKELTAGRHVLCLNIDQGNFYIKNLTFEKYNEDKTMTCTVSRTPATVVVGEKVTITVTAASKTSDVASVDVYANNLLIGTLTEAPYKLEYEPISAGKHSITAVVTDAEGKSKTSTVATLTVNPKRTPYSSIISIPGTIQAENYDKGGEGYSYHDSDANNQGDASFRTDEGVDIVKGNGGKAVGYTAVDEWLEYTVNVTQAGKYTCEAVVSAGGTGSKFTVQRVKGNSKTNLCTIDVPQTGNNDWGTYKTVTKDISTSLSAGEQVFRITITGANCNIDKLVFKLTQDTGINDVDNDAEQTGIDYNLSGQEVDAGYRGIIIRNGRKILKK